MPLNKQVGNMYNFITDTWNTVKGKCSHDCLYCYMKRWGEQPAVHFDERELRTYLGSGNFIFIGSSCDLFAADIPDEWIWITLTKANSYDNQYLVQTKNPIRYFEFFDLLPADKFTLCTTIETNRFYPAIMGKAPITQERSNAMCQLPDQYKKRKMITVEPIMDFDLDSFTGMLLEAEPIQVNIGADSGRNDLPEPPKEKIKRLIDYLEIYTKVVKKPNLDRLFKGGA